MKKLALSVTKIFSLAGLSLATTFAFPTNALAVAGGLQICAPESTCEVGEFLFDDEYAPITTATCTITSNYPDGSSFLSGQSMTGQTDGWYSYKFSAPTSEGLYRTQVCCTSGSDYLCIDKGFEVTSAAGVNSGDIADAVWGYSNRTLSSFGTLARDIWLNSTRTLTSLSVGDSTTTVNITEGGDLNEIKNTTNENRLLLEKLVNEPIIETYLEDDGQTQELGEKLDETRSMANQIFANTQYIRSKASTIVSHWNSFTDQELMSNLQDIQDIIGKEGDMKGSNTVIGNLSWLNNSWDWDSISTIRQQAFDVSDSLDSSIIDITTRGRSRFAYTDIKELGGKLDQIEVLIGDSTSEAPDETLFGKLREVTRIAKALDQGSSEVQDLLVKWEASSESETRDGLNKISQKISPLNRIAQLRNYLIPVTSDVVGKDLKNRAFAMIGVIDTNKKVLANKKDQAVANTWLELGSIIFKSVITNPSKLIAQKAHLKYYLPPELGEEHVIKTSDGISVEYDVERDQFFVEGDFELGISETITVSVSTEDIWIITEEQVLSIKAQIEELMKPIEGTAFYAQGITLKSDINVALDKALALAGSAVTPEQKIRAFREAQIELNGVWEKIDVLKDLVTQVSAAGSLFAFVGGAQTLSVWGIIIVIIASVVFLAMYMRFLKKGEKSKKKKKKSSSKAKPSNPGFIFGQINIPTIARSALVLVVFGGLVSSSTAFVVLRSIDKDSSEVLSVSDSNEPDDSDVVVDESVNEPVALGGEDLVRVNVPVDSSLNIRSDASISSEVVYSLRFSADVVRLGEKESFVNIVIHLGENGEDTIEGWVHEDFVEGSTEEIAEKVSTSENPTKASHLDGQEEVVDNLLETDLNTDLVLINETSTGWLRVRTAPRGAEITRVDAGLTFPYLDETQTWFKIELDENTSGWISKEYSSLQ